MLLDTSGLLPKKADMAEPSVKNCELWVEVGFFSSAVCSDTASCGTVGALVV